MENLLWYLWPFNTGFKWEQGVTALTDVKLVSGIIVIYWVTILLLKVYMKNRPAFSLNFIVPAHNLFLSIWSFFMFLWIIVDIYKISKEMHPMKNFCISSSDDSPALQDAFFHVYIYYLSKFYELLDTVILVLKKKDVIFLHWYHHSIVIWMVFLWLEYHLTFGHLGMLANTLVHTFMYYYYYAAARKMDVWFKRHITNIQIVQFATSFVLCIPFLYEYLTSLCMGIEAWAFAAMCNASFLFLFTQFKKRAYGGKPGAVKAKAT
eukprot:Colp12_sorted_trinity150504_noHs@16449